MKIRFFVLVLLFSTHSFCQSEEKPQPARAYTLGLFGNALFSEFYTGIEGGMQVAKHDFALGIGINPFREHAFKNWGFDLNYMYFPNGRANRFDLFFSVDLVEGIQYYERRTFDNNQLPTGVRKYVSLHHNYTVGFGFNTNLTKRLFVESGLGFGISASQIQFYDLEFSGNIRVGIGYRF